MKTAISKRFLCVALALVLCLGVLGAHGIVPKVNAAEQTYTKVTTAPADWSGTYLIVYEGGSNSSGDVINPVAMNGSLKKLDDKNNGVSVTIANDKISGDFAAYTFTIESVTNGYSIKSASGKYVGNDNNSNALPDADQALVNNISMDGTNVVIKSAGGAYLRYNYTKTELRFRYYKSASYAAQQPIALYKLDGEGGGTTPPIVPPVDPPAQDVLAEVENGWYFIANGDTYLSSTRTGYYNAAVNKEAAGNDEMWYIETVDGKTTITSYKATTKLGLGNTYTSMPETDAVYTEWSIYQAEGGYYFNITRDATEYYLEFASNYNTWDVSETKQVVQLIPATPITVEAPTIVGATLVLEDRMDIRYYLNLTEEEVTSAEEVGFKIWEKGATEPTEYTSGYAVNTANNMVYVSLGGIVAKDITKTYCIKVHVVSGGKDMVTDVLEYSVYDYWTWVSEQTGSIDGFDQAELCATVEALITYGELAATMFDHRT